MDKIKITLNGKEREIPEQMTLAELVRELKIENKNFAIEVNRKVVKKRDHENFKLKDGDKVEIIHFVGGG